MLAGTRLTGMRPALVALASGLVSAGCVLSMETGSLLRLVLVGLAPLPLFVGGLGAGPLTCLAAGLAAAVLVTMTMGSIDGGYYLAAAAIPVAILVWRALRSVTSDKTGQVWYSGSNLLLWLTGLGVAGVLALIGYFAVIDGGLAAAIGERFGWTPAAAAMAARIAPGLAVALWMGVIAVEGVIAGWSVTLFGLAIRPPIEIMRLRLPMWIGLVLMVAGLAGAILREGTIGIVCLSSAIVLIVPYAFLGLALIHALVGNRPGGLAMIAAFYVVLLGSPALLGWRALLIFMLLAGLGSADQLIDFRDLRGLRSGMRRK